MSRTFNQDASSRSCSRTRPRKGISVLDMGSGSGIQAITALQAGAKSVTATDINNKCQELFDAGNTGVLDHCQGLPETLEAKAKLPKEIKFITSNLFQNIKDSFDLIIFNPPYLPEDKREPHDSKQATTGGPQGDEIILQFLTKAPKHLNPNGVILLLLSSLTPKSQIEELLSSLRLRKTTLSTKKIFMEELQVWKIESIKKSPPAQE